MWYVHTMHFLLHDEPYNVTIPEGWEVVELGAYQFAQEGWKRLPSGLMVLDEDNDIPLEKWETLTEWTWLRGDIDLVIQKKAQD